VFALDRVFGFAPAAQMSWARLPYLPIGAGTECVDDVRSAHYNTIVDRGATSPVDWASAERMRDIGQYRLGVTVAYNTPPRAGRGSCIFLHIWAGPDTYTAGCTAMAERDLTALAMWLDGARRPVIVQLPEQEYARRRAAWRLP
jgi:zinc D-Ala-D-Ala dipeptidase